MNVSLEFTFFFFACVKLVFTGTKSVPFLIYLVFLLCLFCPSCIEPLGAAVSLTRCSFYAFLSVFFPFTLLQIDSVVSFVYSTALFTIYNKVY